MPPIQRRSVVVLAVILCGMIWLITSHSAPASVSNYFDVRGMRSVPELYGLIHVILKTGEEEGATASADMVGLDSFSGPLPNGRRIDWRMEKARIDEEYPVVIFSKSYCPYSKRLKSLFLPSAPPPQEPQAGLVAPPYTLHPPPLIIEVDLRPDALAIKQLLIRITGRGTFPNLIIHGESLGGSDEVSAMHQSGDLQHLLAVADLLG